MSRRETAKAPEPGDDIDAMLLGLPIRPANLSMLGTIRSRVRDLQRDRDSWRSQWELYARSWARHLGGRVFNKRHEIDALAMTTDHVYEGYLRALSAGLITETYKDHDLDALPPTMTPGVVDCVFRGGSLDGKKRRAWVEQTEYYANFGPDRERYWRARNSNEFHLVRRDQ